MNSQEYRNLSEAYLDVYQEEVLDEVRGGGEIDPVSDIPGIGLRGARSPRDAGLKMSPVDRAAARANALRRRNDPEATRRANRIDSRFVRPTEKAVNRSLLAATNARHAEKTRLMNPQESYNPDLFDVILEYLITEGYADTNENALVIMANMSEDWRESIVEVTGGGKVEYKPRFGGSSERPGPRVSPQTTQDPEKRGMSSYPSTKTADKINQLNYKKSKIPKESEKGKKLETRVSKLQSRFNRDGKEDQYYVSKEEVDLYDVILEYLIIEGYADTNENALVIMANMSEDWKWSILSEAKKTTSDDMANGDLYSAMFRRDKKVKGAKYDDPSANKYLNMKNSKDRQRRYNDDIGGSRVPSR